VVLAVICLAVVVAIGTLSGAITGALDSVSAILPG
jgi:Flp pilus assembly pilin Flp